MIIIGSGISGILAKEYFRRKFQVDVYEAAPEKKAALSGHQALLRVKTQKAGHILGTKSEPISVEKGIYYKGEFFKESNFRFENMYSLKTNGGLSKRSIASVKPGFLQRYLVECPNIEGVNLGYELTHVGKEHQLVRHRVGVSFAQQSMRTLDVSNFECLATGLCADSDVYKDAVEKIRSAYVRLLDAGVKEEDARGILPTNIKTNILMKINLRALSDMMKSRLCNRAQGEFRDVMLEILREVLDVHPWAAPALKCYCEDTGVCYFKNGKGCGRYESK